MPITKIQELILDDSEEKQHEKQHNSNKLFPVSTLIHSVKNRFAKNSYIIAIKMKVYILIFCIFRPFELSVRKYNNMDILVISFEKGLTLLMSNNEEKRPRMNGVAHLDKHRKFLPSFGKYLHWITFIFPTNFRFPSQIMLTNRLLQACRLMNVGASACFLTSPFQDECAFDKECKIEIVDNIDTIDKIEPHSPYSTIDIEMIKHETEVKIET
jgi:hypothetical protein